MDLKTDKFHYSEDFLEIVTITCLKWIKKDFPEDYLLNNSIFDYLDENFENYPKIFKWIWFMNVLKLNLNLLIFYNKHEISRGIFYIKCVKII